MRAWTPIAAAGLATAFVSVPAAAQLIDAGQQAMIMHQGNLLEQQTAPNNETTNQRRRASPQRPTRVASSGCTVEREREALRPEYERRVRADGQQAANAWLRAEAGALGRRAGEQAKRGAQC